jgi:hypothetical protein
MVKFQFLNHGFSHIVQVFWPHDNEWNAQLSEGAHPHIETKFIVALFEPCILDNQTVFGNCEVWDVHSIFLWYAKQRLREILLHSNVLGSVVVKNLNAFAIACSPFDLTRKPHSVSYLVSDFARRSTAFLTSGSIALIY